MVIRELKLDELEEAKKIYCDSFEKEYVETTINLLGKVIGIYLGAQLIGFCQIDYIHDVFLNKKIAIINSFCIKKDYRCQGYADMLLKEVVSILSKEKVGLINMTSNRNRVYAHRLYNKNHFEEVDTVLFKKEL